MPPIIMAPGYAFILTEVDVAPDTSHEIIPGYVLARATGVQITAIKQHLAPFAGLNYHWRYESEIMSNPDPNARTTTRTGLPTDQWRYWVINYAQPEQRIYSLIRAFALAEPSIEINLRVSINPATGASVGSALRPAGAFSFYNKPGANDASVMISEALLEDVRALLARLEELEAGPQHQEVLNAISDFEVAQMMPRHSTFGALALFAVLESVLTHRSQNDYDSITHQTSTKMNLLGKRFPHPLDYSTFSGATDHVTVWKRLYEYRSVVAHGGRPVFTNRLNMLKDDKTVFEFIHTVVRRVLAYSLYNPEFIADLKMC